MTTVYDVPAEPLIETVASELGDRDEIDPPTWSEFARTGGHRERPPEDEDWWYTRCAAVLRKVYINGPIGTERIAADYGGKRDYGSAPHHAVKGSRSIIRKALQQLQAAGLVDTDDAGRGGRKVTPEGQKFLDDLSHEVQQDLLDEIPELAKY